MAVDRSKAAEVYESSLKAGYPLAEAKLRVKHFVETGTVPEDPTEAIWAAQETQESGGKQSAVSPKGATGVAQIMPSTGPEAAKLADLEWDPVAFKEDPVYNRALGRAYMREQHRRFGNIPTALAAYNAGPGRTQKVLDGEATLPQETRDYIAKITKNAAPKEPAKMTRNDQVKAIYEKVRAAGGGQEELRAELTKAFPDRAKAPAPVSPDQPPVQQAEAPDQAPVTQSSSPGWQPAPGSKMDRMIAVMQNDAQGGTGSQTAAGAERSMLGNLQGIRKLIAQATGAEDTVSEVNGQNQRVKDFWQEKDPDGSGPSPADLGRFGADVATFAAGPGGGATLAGKVAAGAGVGAVQGAIAPTTAEDSQMGNAALGGLLGGAIPAAGAGIKSLIGKLNPEKAAAIASLKGQGVDVPKGAQYEGVIPRMLTKGSNDNYAEVGPDVGSKLAEMMGYKGPLSNEMLENSASSTGKQIGQLTDGVKAPASKALRNKILDIGSEYLSKGLDAKSSDPVMKAAEDLLRRSTTQMTGEEAQALRSQLGSLATKGTAQEQKAYKAMKSALDEHIAAQLPADKAASRTGLNQQYRLAKILRGGSGVPADGATVRQLTGRVEAAANKGNVNSQARKLLQDASVVAPAARVGSDSGGLPASERMLHGNTLGAILQALSIPANAAFRNGIPQSLVNNKAGGKATAEATRNALLPILLRMNSGE